MEPEELPEPGSIRLGADNEVEQFDGTAWQRYEQLPDDGSDTLFRGDDEPGAEEQR